MKIENILLLLSLLTASGCLPNASPGTWVPLEESTSGYRSPSFYTNTAIRILMEKQPSFDSTAYRWDGPYRPEPEDRRTRYPRWVEMSLFRCHTPDKLRSRQNPVELESIAITLNSRGKLMFIDIETNTCHVTDWELQQYLYLGIEPKWDSQQKPAP